MPVDSSRRFSSPYQPTPRTLLLSNGSYSLLLSAAGSGYSRWRDIALTRWREDPTCDPWGSYIFLRDVFNGEAARSSLDDMCRAALAGVYAHQQRDDIAILIARLSRIPADHHVGWTLPAELTGSLLDRWRAACAAYPPAGVFGASAARLVRQSGSSAPAPPGWSAGC